MGDIFDQAIAATVIWPLAFQACAGVVSVTSRMTAIASGANRMVKSLSWFEPYKSVATAYQMVVAMLRQGLRDC